jgi:large subunit ribosomal protein L24
MKVKKGDNVIVVAGKDRGKKGKVLRALPSADRLVVEGVNIKKKHRRPRKSNEKGQILQIAYPFHVSNVQLFCSGCNKGVRVGAKVTKGKKVRACAKCKKEI